MDYKKIIKSRNLRIKILNLLSFVPDKLMIKIQYRIKTGRKLNLKNPQRFTEKIQWYKLYYRNPVMHLIVDKYEVRKYVKSKGLDNLLNELYGVYNTVEDIDFNSLPQQFVIKTTVGGGGQNVLICKDKSKLNIEETKKMIKQWQRINKKKSYCREWAYESTKNRIIVEKYLENDDSNLVDYKFFCFKGKIYCLYVISERDFGKMAKLGIYDKDYNKINAYRCDEEKQLDFYPKPKQFELMKKYASILSKDFPHARIDFYEYKNEVIFGEITFYDGSGYMKYEPDEFDYDLGKEFKLIKF